MEILNLISNEVKNKRRLSGSKIIFLGVNVVLTWAFVYDLIRNPLNIYTVTMAGILIFSALICRLDSRHVKFSLLHGMGFELDSDNEPDKIEEGR